MTRAEQPTRRKIISRVAETLCALAVLLALVPLAMILFYVIKEGVGALNLDFFTQHAEAGRRGGRRHGERDRRAR